MRTKKFNLASPVTILIISWIIGGFGYFIEEPEFIHYTFEIISLVLFILAIVLYLRD